MAHHTEVLYGAIIDHEEIEQCLNCGKPECDNCMRFAYKNRAGYIAVFNASEFARLYNRGYSYIFIARKLGIHHDTLSKRTREDHLRSVQPRPKLDREFFEALPEQDRKFITWEGGRLA